MEGNTFREFAVSQMLLAHAEELYAGMQRFNPTVNVSLEKKKVTQEDYLAWWSKAIPGHFEKLEALLGQCKPCSSPPARRVCDRCLGPAHRHGPLHLERHHRRRALSVLHPAPGDSSQALRA